MKEDFLLLYFTKCLRPLIWTKWHLGLPLLHKGLANVQNVISYHSGHFALIRILRKQVHEWMLCKMCSSPQFASFVLKIWSSIMTHFREEILFFFGTNNFMVRYTFCSKLHGKSRRKNIPCRKFCQKIILGNISLSH